MKELICVLDDVGIYHEKEELIRCKDCKKWHINYLPIGDKHGCSVMGNFTKPNDYCYKAERREK